MPTPAGWYADPSGRYESRYWDGSRWTNDVRGQAQGPPADATGQPADTTSQPAGATSQPADVTIAGAEAATAAGLDAGDPDRPLTRAERQAAMHGAPRGNRRWVIVAAILAVLLAGGVVAALSLSGDDTSVKTPQTTTSAPHTSTTHPSSTTSTSSVSTTTTTIPGATTTKPSTTTTPPSSAAATGAALPPQVVTTGTWCTNTGATGVNSKGTPMVCSATAKDGTPYPQPTWRPA